MDRFEDIKKEGFWKLTMEDFNWLICEFEKLKRVITWIQNEDRFEDKETHTCGTCDHWIGNEHKFRQWCQMRGHSEFTGVHTTRDFACDVNCWIPKESKPELPEQFKPLETWNDAFDMRDTINPIIKYLKAKEKEDV